MPSSGSTIDTSTHRLGTRPFASTDVSPTLASETASENNIPDLNMTASNQEIQVARDPRKMEDGNYPMTIKLCLLVDGQEISSFVEAILDTGCSINVISLSVVRQVFGMEISPTEKIPILQAFGGEPVYSMGSVQGRWVPVGRDGIVTDYKFTQDVFHVLEEQVSFDVILGHETLQKMGIELIGLMLSGKGSGPVSASASVTKPKSWLPAVRKWIRGKRSDQ